MILESYYWKKELLKTSEKLKKKIKVKKYWTPKKYAKFEKEIMFGFYIIRKLIEANKLTNKIVSTKKEYKVHNNLGTKITIRNRHSFDEYYDFGNYSIRKSDLKFLNNQFIHSYIFSPIISTVDDYSLKLMKNEKLTDEEHCKIHENSEKEVIGIFFNSDKNKDKSIFQIDIKTIIEIFQDVGNCNVTSISMKYNEKKDDWDCVLKDDENKIPNESLELINKLEE
ncbi:hypothetical protein [Tenacibaculum dicentrarchi]|uniref:hypothetical protein n=1 Tax=Tenacibaculum dicentrarchi TaxID=669041 RepID=UPI00351866AE